MAMDDTAGRFAAIERERQRRVGWRPEQTAERLRRDYPELARQTVAKADEALAGLLILPSTGGRPAFVGDPPRWHEVHPTDGEYGWLLNRMSHWGTLLRAWKLTGDDRYADKVARELDNWIATAPCPGGDERDLPSVNRRFNATTPWRALEVGIRMYSSWYEVARMFAGTRWFDAGRADRFAAAVAQHAEVLSIYAPILWPNFDHNHLMMEMLGLLHAALMLPDDPRSPVWRRQAMESLVTCCDRQFTEGGGQIEGCPHYHIVCLNVVVLGVGALREHGHDVPPRLLAHLRDGVGYMLQTTRPTGDIVPWGDSDPHSSAPAAAMAYWALGDPRPLQLLRTLTSADHVRQAIAASAWKLGDVAAALAAADQPPAALPPTVAWHKGLDQLSARTGWDRDAAMVFFACRSPVNNAHAHIDPAGFDYTAFGKPLLVDPGRFTYAHGDDRREFKVASAHNTLTVNGRDPFEYTGAWSYEGQGRGVMRSVERRDGRVVMECEQDNFAPAIHRRQVVLLDSGVLGVVDRLTDLPAGASVQRWFHVNSTTLQWDASAHVAWTDDDDVNVAIFTTADVRGEILPGRISHAIDRAYPSQRLCLHSTAGDAVATIVPYRGRRRPDRPDLNWD